MTAPPEYTDGTLPLTDQEQQQDPSGSFGVEAFTQDDRLRLFAFASAEKSTQYLWTLRAMEHARANYVVLLHAGDVAAALAELADDFAGQADVPPLSAEMLRAR